MSDGMSVLVVDDEAIIREIIQDIMRCDGREVESVAVGTCREALDQVRSRAFDVIFLDVCMEDGDGAALVQKVAEAQPEARIYMITGYRVEERLGAALAAGACGSIYKPFTVSEILEVVGGHGAVVQPVRN